MADNKLDIEEMSEQYSDVLKEIGNIGAGNAMTALAQLIQSKIDMKVPQVKLLEFYELGAEVGGEEQIMASIYLAVEGDITGSILFLLEKQSARHLVSKLMGMELAGDDFSEIEVSALKEIGNIITGSYLNALSSMTGLTIYPSVPDLSIDMAAAVLSVPAIEFGILGDKILLIQTQFFDETEINGYFILLPDVDSYEKILTSLGLLS
ncbi:MAG: chemotaxis protein CheC [Lachnospiraceae bacterium]|nr:chemotaxis protein CheC [Lachnospiraceae bacterium]MBR3684479.1 chemotaxis protein CheC [Lachnospiraceae bacterium]